jgi:hypothetical protein
VKKQKRIVSAEIERRHRRHVKRFARSSPGSLPQADGHALTMVVTTTFRCECGCKLTKRTADSR